MDYQQLIDGVDAAQQEREALNQQAEAEARAELRDRFAMAALTGMLATDTDESHWQPHLAAPRAYEFADAMLAARDAKGGA